MMLTPIEKKNIGFRPILGNQNSLVVSAQVSESYAIIEHGKQYNFGNVTFTQRHCLLGILYCLYYQPVSHGSKYNSTYCVPYSSNC